MKDPIEVEEVRRLYVEEKWRVARIAAHFGVTRQAVYQRMKAAGISLERRPLPLLRTFDRQVLEDLYFEQGRNVTQIAEKLRSSLETVRRELKRHGLYKPTLHEKRNYPALRSLKIGDQFVMVKPAGKHPGSNMFREGKKLGIRIVTRRIDGDHILVIRTPLLTHAAVKKMHSSGMSRRKIAAKFRVDVKTIKRFLTSGK